jgi:hypothetical protein
MKSEEPIQTPEIESFVTLKKDAYYERLFSCLKDELDASRLFAERVEIVKELKAALEGWSSERPAGSPLMVVAQPEEIQAISARLTENAREIGAAWGKYPLPPDYADVLRSTIQAVKG